jgi:ABC-type dipeptide/oligopeptide/nickel transport system permease component
MLFVALVSTAALILARRAPGDYTDTLRAARVPDEAIARERGRLYLDRSLPELSAIWIGGLARLDLGTSYRFARPVRDLLIERLPRTLALAGAAALFSLVLGVLWGTGLAAGHPLLRRALEAIAALVVALPAVVVLFIYLFIAVRAGWLGPGEGGVLIPVLGILSLLVPSAGGLARMHAEALAEALDEPWALASVARGVPGRVLLWKLGMRIAVTRAISVMPLLTANIFGASLLIEVVTGWAGLGRLMLDALVARDIFLVAGCTAAICASVAALGLAADAAVAALDPRVEAGS